MSLFENLLILLVAACLLLQLSRRLALPYPALLALAGVCVGVLPWVPQFAVDPKLALALFVAPALFDSAFDTAPRELRRNWKPLVALVLVAVLLTTASVAWLGWAVGGLPLAAAVTLGAIVAPPDAVAAAAVMERFDIPRRTLSVINGESLLNDAVALLVFDGAMSMAMGDAQGGSSPLPHALMLLVEVPGGALVGFLLGRLNLRLGPVFAGTRSAIIQQFVMVFGAWIIADRLHLSAILAVVAFGMTVARSAPARSSAVDRIYSYAVWGAAVFVLNVVAFLLMGLQVRGIVGRLSADQLGTSLAFAAMVLAVVVGVRMAWVLIYGALARRFASKGMPEAPTPSLRIGVLVGWSGMRGLVTLATSFALPDSFPQRDLIVLSAFTVVLGTLVIQGFTLGWLMTWLKIGGDDTLGRETSVARTALMERALTALQRQPDCAPAVMDSVREEYEEARDLSRNETDPQGQTRHDQLRLVAIEAQRGLLNEMRDAGQVDDDVYHRLEREMDWSEMSAAPSGELKLESV
ncbi:MAG: sodium/hydrogen exchanger [Rhizobacter sp.]|nr:sodium/hydrogen exchanger [Rhizobacter sp.]